MHEWEDADIITWVFNDGFVSAAKLTNSGNYSIISDHLGTPVEAYDAEGKCVWTAELDIYGRVIEHTGEVGFVPFRYQGQYEDVETGLYYNRFRYYDPVTGQYTQQDPIGLAGNNPTLYAYTSNPLLQIDPFGLDELYALLANKDGWYNIMQWGKKNPIGQIFLKEGELWKIGTSKNALERYSASFIRDNNLKMAILHSDINNATAKYWERTRIKGYESAKCRH